MKEQKMKLKRKDAKKMVKKEDLIFETKRYIYNIQKCKAIISFGIRSFAVFGGKITLNNAEKYQKKLLR